MKNNNMHTLHAYSHDRNAGERRTFYYNSKKLNMKLKSSKSSFTRGCIMLLAIVAVVFFSSCTRKVSFQDSSVVPGARGTVKVKKDNNSNYNIQISLSHLAEAKKLQPSRQTYVVWMESQNEATKNVGQINTSTSLLSGKFKSSFETVSNTKPSKIFITAEDDGAVQFPGSQVVLSTESL